MMMSDTQLDATWLNEPFLEFGGGFRSEDPKIGISLGGPKSFNTPRHKSEVHLAYMGDPVVADAARNYYETTAREGVVGDSDHTGFPGCDSERTFRCQLQHDVSKVGLFTRKETIQISNTRSSKERFAALEELVKEKFALIADQDFPTNLVVICLSDELYKSCRTIDFVEKGQGKVHRDLRRMIKALGMKYRIATQIILASTVGVGERQKALDHPSVIAWNLFTGMYFKVDGLPWGPLGLEPDSCFIGISFYRPNDAPSNQLRTSCVQAFDENGDGLILRGHSFLWNEEKDGKSPHLPEDLAHDLVHQVLRRYQQERGRKPRRTVIHKSSRFDPAEREGFERALEVVNQYDLVSLSPTSSVRMVRTGQYPPHRGTFFRVADQSFLYTTGYLQKLGRYPHGHVPSPLRVADHVGDTVHKQLLTEVLALTKMNWNSANMSTLLPITLQFSKQVSEVLKELPPDQDPEPKYKFYM